MKGHATEAACRDGALHIWHSDCGWTRPNAEDMNRRSVCTRCFALKVEDVKGISKHPKPCYCYDGVFCKGEFQLSVKD